MPAIARYERPSTIAEARSFLSRAPGLDHIEAGANGGILIGAMVTLQALANNLSVPAALREAARREAPGTVATIGGCVATADPDSELFAALLAHDALVRTAAGVAHPLSEPLRLDAGDFIVAVQIRVGPRDDPGAPSRRTGS